MENKKITIIIGLIVCQTVKTLFVTTFEVRIHFSGKRNLHFNLNEWF